MTSLREIAIKYFELHPEAKRLVIEKGLKLFPDVSNISDIIKKEEESYFRLLVRGRKVIERIKEENLTGELLCKLHHTHGIDPTVVEDIIGHDLPQKLHDDYCAEYEKHKETGKKGKIK